MNPTLRAVTFDHWNTLVHERVGSTRDARLDAWLGILEGVGFAVERQRLDAAFAVSWERFVSTWESNQAQYRSTEAAVDIIEELGFDLPPGVHDELVEAFASAPLSVDLMLCDGAEECLRALKDAGLRLGIVCDVGMTPSTALRANLERKGVLDLFDHWSFSDDVGAYKPSPAIFEHALAGLGGVAPAQVAHVGDLRRTDVAGAKAMGMVTVRYTGVFDDAGDDEQVATGAGVGSAGGGELPEADHVVADLRQIPKVLGICD
ncbi:MAG TPA: HAD family hydrolase [Acidimicrobiales bacterium]